MAIFLSIIVTLLVIFIVPVLVYSLFTALFGLKEPEKKLSFMMSVLIQKIGTSIGFVLLFALGVSAFGDQWLLYSLLWAIMFAIVEVGQAIGPSYSNKEAVAGIISEAIYFPLAGFIVFSLLT